MRFADLRLLAREPKVDRVRPDVLTAISLPMPDDVLEQFVYDHGLKGAFQKQYGHLDLDLLHWSLEHLAGSEIVKASVYAGFDRHEQVRQQVAAAATSSEWDAPCLPGGAAAGWKREGTWSRPPVFLVGALVGSDSELHLVEGHTRLGALMGLLDIERLPPEAGHAVWVGCPLDAASCRDRVIHVEQRISFLDWVFDQMTRPTKAGDLAMWLAGSRPRGSDAPAVADHIRSHRPAFSPVLDELLDEWTRVFATLEG